MALSTCASSADERQRENTHHGTPQFPLACYEDDLVKLPVSWHWHEEFECIVALEGTVSVCLRGGRTLLSPGEGVFLNSGVLHAVESGGEGPSSLRSLVFHPRLVGGSADSVFWSKLVQPLLRDRDFRDFTLRPQVPWQGDILHRIMLAWQATAREQADYENLARYQLSAALGLLQQNRPAVTRKSTRQDQISAQRMKHMLRFIEGHFAEELTLARIADSVSLSSSACLRCFRQLLGVTPIQYVKQLRLEKAAELLLTTHRQVNAIAADCGFSDVSYFTKSFREEKGCTPGQYRARFQQP